MAAAREQLWDILLSGRQSVAGAPRRRRSKAASAHQVPLGLSNQDAHRVVRQGIPADVLTPLANVLDLGVTQLAPLLGMDRTTLRRYSANEEARLPSHTIETILRLAELEALARETFASEEGARRWLKTAHPMLDDETPLEAAATSYGGGRVRELLVAIRHGGVV